MERYASIVAAVAVAALPAGGSAQTPRQPSAMQQGAGQLMYGSCMTDALSTSQKSAAAALAALAPTVARNLVQTYEPTDEIAMYCSKAIHDQRCTTKILAVAGDQLDKLPGGQAMPPGPNPLTVPGAVAGAVLGGLWGASRDSTWTGAAVGAVGLGWAASKYGSNLYNGGAAAACVRMQQQLDAASAKLVGRLGPLGSVEAQDALLLIADNVRTGRIPKAEGDALAAEVQRLAGKVDAVLQAMR